tara:strand:+ start:767 stop:1222 length:456 start_codon:yes stop_codon:yes gene_type:complete
MITQEILKELLNYDPVTGDFTWKERDLKWFNNKNEQKSFNVRHSGNIAGTTDNTKSVARLVLLGENYKPSDLAWLYNNGKFKAEKYKTAPVRGQKFPYGYTDVERADFARAFSKLAGKMSVADIAEKLNLEEKQVRKFATVSGWSIKIKKV